MQSNLNLILYSVEQKLLLAANNRGRQSGGSSGSSTVETWMSWRSNWLNNDAVRATGEEKWFMFHLYHDNPNDLPEQITGAGDAVAGGNWGRLPYETANGVDASTIVAAIIITDPTRHRIIRGTKNGKCRVSSDNPAKIWLEYPKMQS